ncbi:MAG TPA: TolC family protein [Isosphaeraceae bacterium]|nr:TolC family protein [Isosphaeraceae bacterium]
MAIPAGAEDEGPPDGLTLDAAIERLMRANLNLRAQALEIPQAQADILTAGLRANPVFYADGQLIPYGGFPKDRPGGPTQYDVNISYPLDVTRKRRARTAVASQAKRVIEAQFQDAVRLQIENLYTAYVDVLAARETVRFARTSLTGLGKLLQLAETQREKEFSTTAEVNRVKILRDAAEIGVQESESALRQARRTLAVLLRVPPAQADALELRGTIRDVSPPPPPEEGLIRVALASRPDLVAYRLGVGRAAAEVRLAHANRLSDVYVLYQPFTSQDNPAPQRDATSWALGVTVPLPIYNRNQGNIRRARVNVDQTRTELAALEEQVVSDVRKAREQYVVSRASVERIERDLLPASRQVLSNAAELYQSGQENLAFYLNAQRDYNEIVRQYRDTLVRHRRNMLNLNTVVGERILP